MQERDNTPRFGAVARQYWDAGLPVIPLHYREKSPILTRWTTFCAMMPTAEMQEEWLMRYGVNNIGLPLGEQSKIVMLDIDTDSEIVGQLIRKVAGNSLWERKGRKGAALAYRWSGERSFQIKDDAGKVLVELLSHGRQVVLPPSIHPDTQAEYISNCHLYEVSNALQPLPENIDVILRGIFESHGIKLLAGATSRVVDFVSAGARDNAMTRMAGLLSWAVSRGERTFKEAEGMMRVWHANLVEKVAGDDLDVNKGVANIARFLVKDVLGEKKIMLPQGWDEGMTEDEKGGLGLSLDQDHVEWPFEQLKEWLKGEFQKHERSSPYRAKAVQLAINRIAHSPNLTEIEQGMLFRYMTDNVGGLSVSTIRKELRNSMSGGIQGQSHIEIANAVTADLAEFGEMRLEAGVAWQWGGSHWHRMDENAVRRHISVQYGNLPLARKDGDHRQILKTFRDNLPEGLKTTDIDGVNFANGFVDRRPSLLAHDPSYGAKYTLPFRFLPEGAEKPSIFFDYLESVWGEDPDFEQKKLALQEALCATIYGVAAEFQTCFLLQGVGNSGKSVMIDIVASLIPPEARCAVSPGVWDDKFAPMAMYGKLLNVCGELSSKDRIKGDRFKQIVAGDEISAAYKGRDPQNFKPTCAHWFASNHLPRTEDRSTGFNRRWLILTFNRPVPEEKKVLRLAEIIVADEREKIVSWAIQAIGRLTMQKRYTQPSSHVEKVRQMSFLNSSVRHFIAAERMRLGASGSVRISAMTLYDQYFAFCIKQGVVARVSRTAFVEEVGSLMTEYNFQKIETRQETLFEFPTLAD